MLIFCCKAENVSRGYHTSRAQRELARDRADSRRRVGHQREGLGELTLVVSPYLSVWRQYGKTGLMTAARYGQLDIMRLLVDRGANPLLRNEVQMTSLFLKAGLRE